MGTNQREAALKRPRRRRRGVPAPAPGSASPRMDRSRRFVRIVAAVCVWVGVRMGPCVGGLRQRRLRCR